MGVLGLLQLLSLFGLSGCVEITVRSPIFDIQKVNNEDVTLEEGTFFGISYKSFLAKDASSFGKIVDSGATLWEAEGTDGCTAVNLFSKGDSTLMSLVTREFALCFREKINSIWMPISEGDFDKRFSSLNENFKPTSETGYQLELGNEPGDNKILPYTYTLKGIVYQSYTPKNGVLITSVVDGSDTLWVAQETKCVAALTYSANGKSLCSLDIANLGGNAQKRYFEKVDGAWKAMGYESFYKALEVILRSNMSDIKVDIQSSSCLSFENTEYNDYGVDTRFVVPVTGFKIVSLYNGKERIWEAKGDEYCTGATFFKKRGVHVASLNLNGEEKYVECFEGIWGRITAETFSKRLSKIMGVVKPTEQEEVEVPGKTLNVASADETSFKTFKYLTNGVPMTKYIPSNGEKVDKVTDEGSEIWSGNGGDKCLLSEVYSKGSFCAVVLYVTVGGKSMFKYFEQVQNEWKSMNKMDFAKKLVTAAAHHAGV